MRRCERSLTEFKVSLSRKERSRETSLVSISSQQGSREEEEREITGSHREPVLLTEELQSH